MRYAAGLLAVGVLALCGCTSLNPQTATIIIQRQSAASFTFSALPRAGICHWHFGDGVQTNSYTVEHTYGEPGSYTVNLNIHTDSGTLSAHTVVVAGAEWHVGEWDDLQEAVDSADPGDTIFVEGLHGIVTVNKDLELVGVVTIDEGIEIAPTLRRITYDQCAGSLSNLTLTGDNALQAVTLHHASPAITGCTITGNDIPHYGAGVYAAESDAQFVGCEFVDNHSRIGGGAVYAVGQSAFPRFEECTFTDNRSDACGGAILIHSEQQSRCAAMEIDRCVFTGNSAQGNLVGGAVHIGVGCDASIRDCQFSGNRPQNVGRDKGI